MLTRSILPMQSRPVAADAARRVSHGSTAFARDLRMTQPQDGAPEIHARLATLLPRIPSAAGIEPDDARLTGSTRSLFRRVMGLNVMTVPEATQAILSRKAQRLLAGATVTKQVA